MLIVCVSLCSPCIKISTIARQLPALPTTPPHRQLQRPSLTAEGLLLLRGFLTAHPASTKRQLGQVLMPHPVSQTGLHSIFPPSPPPPPSGEMSIRIRQASLHGHQTKLSDAGTTAWACTASTSCSAGHCVQSFQGRSPAAVLQLRL